MSRPALRLSPGASYQRIVTWPPGRCRLRSRLGRVAARTAINTSALSRTAPPPATDATSAMRGMAGPELRVGESTIVWAGCAVVDGVRPVDGVAGSLNDLTWTAGLGFGFGLDVFVTWGFVTAGGV
jgi:hypothetical protein